MLKVEKVIVTVVANKRISIDMELPIFLPITDLADKMLETLKILYPVEFESVSDIQLIRQGALLAEQSTLASNGVWDGAVLEVVRR